LHTLSTRIIRENQTICVESLRVKTMVNHPTLAKAIHDVGWGAFGRQLAYKAAWYGRTLVAIDQWYPSSKRCSDCGHVLDSLALALWSRADGPVLPAGLSTTGRCMPRRRARPRGSRSLPVERL
jgi:IS605 OrfB family transposase